MDIFSHNIFIQVPARVLGVMVMVFNATLKKYSSYIVAVSLIVGGTGVPAENHRPAVSHWQALSHNLVSSTPHLSEFRT